MRFFQSKPEPEPEPEVEEATHPTPDYVVPLGEPATPIADLVTGDGMLEEPFDRVWGWKDNIQHVIDSGLTTFCDLETDRGAETRRLAFPPTGLLCGICIRKS